MLPADFFCLTCGVSVLNEIVGLVVDTAATVLAAGFLLRFWAQAVRARPPEAVARMIFKLSNWLVLPLRRIIPPVGGYDWPCLFGTLLAAALAVVTTSVMANHIDPKFILLGTLLQFLNWVVYGFMGLLVFEALFSWINPHAPLAPFIAALNQPLLRPLRRLIPPLGGIDLSVLVALVLLRIVLRLFSEMLASFL